MLEVHEIDPGNPATEVAPSTVLWDGVISSAPGYCAYAVINSSNLECSLAFTWIGEAPDVEVRSALPGQGYRPRLVGALRDGAECTLTLNATLDFFSAYVPSANELIEVYYRGSGRSVARVTNPASIAAEQQGTDNGVHAAVRHVKLPLARTAADCENAALAILDDSAGPVWAGEYQAWSDFLPGRASDIFPGDALAVTIPACKVAFQAVVQRVDISIQDLEGDRSFYKIAFTQAADPAFSFEFEAARIMGSLDVTAFANAQIGSAYLTDLTTAEVTQVTSTTVSVDAGIALPNGGGCEVRWSDAGWGPDNDRNLTGRFGTRTFTLPRLSRTQTCYLRQYDGSVPPKYSRYAAALHVDYPL